MAQACPKADRWRLLVGIGMLALAGAACVPVTAEEEGDDTAALEAAVVVPNAPPEQLAGVLQEASQRSMELAEKIASGDRSQTTLRELKRQLFTGIKAAEKLLAHPGADDAQKLAARKQQLAILYLGARRDPVVFEPRFAQFVDKLVAEDRQGEVAALAAAMRLERDRASSESPLGRDAAAAGRSCPDLSGQRRRHRTLSHVRPETGVAIRPERGQGVLSDPPWRFIPNLPRRGP